MAKCQVCGKSTGFGKNISHAHNRTLRTFGANVQKVRVNVNGTVKRMNVCTRCIKSKRVVKAV